MIGGSFGIASGLIAGGCYIVVTILFYGIFKPVNRNLSLLAAIISLGACAIGPLLMLLKLHLPGNIALVFFGVYCLLIGYLIFRSNFCREFWAR